jgi:hypothetical protein
VRTKQTAELLLRGGLGHCSDATLATVDDDLGDTPLDGAVLAVDHHAVGGSFAASSMRGDGTECPPAGQSRLPSDVSSCSHSMTCSTSASPLSVGASRFGLALLPSSFPLSPVSRRAARTH